MAWDRSAGKKKKGRKLRVDSWQKSAAGIIGGIALGLGACWGATVIVSDYHSRIKVAAAPEPTRLVMVAARDLHPGVKVSEADVFAVALPTSSVDPGMVLFPEGIVGKYTKERILGNEFVRTARIANPERGEGLNAILPRDMRALSIELSNGAALSGHLQPGSYVDVLATYYPDDDEQNPVTQTIVQGLFLLAVNERSVVLSPQQEREGRRVPRPSVTFLVTPDEAEKITFAERTTALRLTERNDLDTQYAVTHGVDMDALLGRLGLETEPPPTLSIHTEDSEDSVRMISGSTAQDTRVASESPPRRTE